MFARFSGAAARGILVALLIATPSFLLPPDVSSAPEIGVLLAIIAGFLTFVEYNSNFPSYIEFRDAPPLNRIRFFALFSMILISSLVVLHRYEPTNLTAIVTGLGVVVSRWVDFPYSPVRLVVLVMASDTPRWMIQATKIGAGVSYCIGLVAIAAFFVSIRVSGWPTGRGAFNVWVNLPLFDPTTGGDVVARLQRDGRVHVVFGVLLPFLVPAVAQAAADLLSPVRFADPNTVIWAICAWAFLPATIVMRGMAMLRVAQLIAEKRRRSYARTGSAQAV